MWIIVHKGFTKQIDSGKGNSEMELLTGNIHTATANEHLGCKLVSDVFEIHLCLVYVHCSLGCWIKSKKEKLISNNRSQSFCPFIWHTLNVNSTEILSWRAHSHLIRVPFFLQIFDYKSERCVDFSSRSAEPSSL